MDLGGTTAEYDRKFATPVVTRINQTDEEQAILERNARIAALKTYAVELRAHFKNSEDEKYKRYLALKIDRTNQRLEQLRTEE
ncbi:hypothetical protein QYC20_17175 (plasmid) [Lactiplantibacillus pentosus]|uniref:hypothetical protein n=1 Tax=Lactiplantibacillus pentosus TaxID=1589 RepID=UPI00265AB439|nr:hypothetical protein [Lactiplantibacillus pentosus]WKF77725.1 hypothetical protein QYC20_17175 [Lactiplantibacillus pentosus]